MIESLFRFFIFCSIRNILYFWKFLSLEMKKLIDSMRTNILLIIFILYLIVSSCAKIGAPTGGPKDEDPPRILKSIPSNYSVGYDGNKVELTFDEYIQLKNLDKELLISPPLKERLLTRFRQKTLIIDLNNELHDSTTYTLNFGNALLDNNEGNILPNYEFVFSTGKMLDTLSVVVM